MVKRFDHEFPNRFSDEIFKYLSIPSDEFPEASKMFEEPIMTKSYFERLTDSFRSLIYGSGKTTNGSLGMLFGISYSPINP